MKGKIKPIMRAICFVALLIFLFAKVNDILMRKSISGSWDMTIKTNGFYNEKEDSIEVMGFGSSHMYCTINPLVMWEQAGIPSYLLTSQQQPPCATYYYIKEALKTQTPDVIFLETYMFTLKPAEYDEGVYHDAIDFLKPSENKRALIKELVPESERKNYYIPFLKYHTRWEELNESDFDNSYLDKKDWLKGHVFLKDSQPISIDEEIVNSERRLPIPEENLKYLNKIVELSKQEGFKLVFIAAPYVVNEEEQGVFNSIGDYAVENGIEFIDFNKMSKELKINTDEDFYDTGHTNVKGAEKVTRYLADYLKNQYNLSDLRGNETYLDYDESLNRYNTEK